LPSNKPLQRPSGSQLKPAVRQQYATVAMTKSVAVHDEHLRHELLTLAAEDLRVREELAGDGSLFQGYHPRMEAVHKRSAARLGQIIAERGWPGTSVVGSDGAEAAWLIVQHAIGEPDFMRSSLGLLRRAAERGDTPAWQGAMLEDRIRMFEGRPQRFGTQLEPDRKGYLQPYWLENPEFVDERRRAVGLEPLTERLARAPEHLRMTEDRDQFEREYQAWLRRVGWRA
jgi:hypothetical protein